MGFYNYSTGEIINFGDRINRDFDGYFDRMSSFSWFAPDMQNGEWDVQQKISVNEDRYFDFSKNMIDVGAYIGIYRWNLRFQKAWLFEPNKESFMYCCANAILRKHVHDTFIYNECLSNKREVVSFNGYECVSDDLKGSGDTNHVYFEKNVELVTKRLDDFLSEFDNIGFIKVDCEGMDWKVIDGAEKTIRLFNNPPILFENWMDDGTYPSGLNESDEARISRNKNIRRVLEEKHGYKILWRWGDHETHLAIHE